VRAENIYCTYKAESFCCDLGLCHSPQTVMFKSLLFRGGRLPCYSVRNSIGLRRAMTCTASRSLRRHATGLPANLSHHQCSFKTVPSRLLKEHEALDQRVKSLINTALKDNDVVLFMKGTPSWPKVASSHDATEFAAFVLNDDTPFSPQSNSAASLDWSSKYWTCMASKNSRHWTFWKTKTYEPELKSFRKWNALVTSPVWLIQRMYG
jgi:hypothetical protein